MTMTGMFLVTVIGSCLAGAAQPSATLKATTTATAAPARSVAQIDPDVGSADVLPGTEETVLGCGHSQTIVCGTFTIKRVKAQCHKDGHGDDDRVLIGPRLRFDPPLRDVVALSGTMVREDGVSSHLCWAVRREGKIGKPFPARFPTDLHGKIEFTLTERSDRGGKVCVTFTKRVRRCP